MSKNITIVQSYFNAVTNGNFETLKDLFANDVIWYQPGNGIQSGIYNGKAALFTHLGNFMKWSNGTFTIDNVEYIADNGDLVTAALHFKAENGEEKIAMKGIDLLRIEDGRIKEVWLFSENIQEEDTFWTNAAE